MKKVNLQHHILWNRKMTSRSCSIWLNLVLFHFKWTTNPVFICPHSNSLCSLVVMALTALLTMVINVSPSISVGSAPGFCSSCFWTHRKAGKVNCRSLWQPQRETRTVFLCDYSCRIITISILSLSEGHEMKHWEHWSATHKQIHVHSLSIYLSFDLLYLYLYIYLCLSLFLCFSSFTSTSSCLHLTFHLYSILSVSHLSPLLYSVCISPFTSILSASHLSPLLYSVSISPFTSILSVSHLSHLLYSVCISPFTSILSASHLSPLLYSVCISPFTSTLFCLHLTFHLYSILSASHLSPLFCLHLTFHLYSILSASHLSPLLYSVCISPFTSTLFCLHLTFQLSFVCFLPFYLVLFLISLPTISWSAVIECYTYAYVQYTTLPSTCQTYHSTFHLKCQDTPLYLPLVRHTTLPSTWNVRHTTPPSTWNIFHLKYQTHHTTFHLKSDTPL